MVSFSANMLLMRDYKQLSTPALPAAWLCELRTMSSIPKADMGDTLTFQTL